MFIDVSSTPDCRELITRIQQTLSAKGYDVQKIQEAPKPFPLDDAGIFEGLCEAILTRQASWASVQKILPALKISLFNYDVNKVSALADSDIKALSNQYKGKVKARFFENELFAIRDNAKVFQKIMSEYGSVCAFIKSYLPAQSYDQSCNCYIRPADDPLIKCFIDRDSTFKLHDVGLAICCEFFNNIGIDEFKPDVHTTRFLNRVNLNRGTVRVSEEDRDVRKIGILIAETLQKPRKYVDSHIWCFCAEGEGEICTENDPKCDSCMLIKQPQLCPGFPNMTQIVKNPLGAAKRFHECNLTRKEASKKMKRVGLALNKIDEILSEVYGNSE